MGFSKIGLEIVHPPAATLNSDGKTVGHEEALIQRELFTLSYEAGQWVIDDTIGYRSRAPS